MNISIRRAAGPLLAALLLACLAVAGLRPSLAAEPQAGKKFVYIPVVSHGLPPVVPGYWNGGANQFYVTPDGANVNKFAVRIKVAGCGSYKITRTKMAPISNKKFSFVNYYFSGAGTFTTPKSATGTDRLYRLYIAGCGYVSGGPWTWNVTWQNSSQPASAALAAEQSLAFEAAEVVAAEGAQPAAEGDAEYTVELLAPAEPAAPAAEPASAPSDAPAPKTQPARERAGDEQTVEPAQ
jgi:hypothetical protein